MICIFIYFFTGSSDNYYHYHFICSWKFHTEKELNGSSHGATLATYPGSGFYQDLSTTRAKTAELISELKANRWIDRGTRAVFLDFTIYNPNVNLFTVAKWVNVYGSSLYFPVSLYIILIQFILKL